MKKFLAVALALTSVSAFAQKHMVQLSGYESGESADRSLNFFNQTGGAPNEATRDINLNYSYAVTDALQLGVIYKNHLLETSGDVKNVGDESQTYGVQAIWNFAHKLIDTCYVGLKYEMQNIKETDTTGHDGGDVNTLTLAYGHRFGLGKLGGMDFTYAPEANLGLAKASSDISGSDDQATTTVSINFVKFDVLF